MIILQVLAGILMVITIIAAVISNFYEVVDVNELAKRQAEEIEASNAQAIVGNEPVVEVSRTPGAVVCKFDPVTDSPQQFAADYLFGELARDGDIYTFSARVAVPSGGYTVSFGPMTMVGNQVILPANLNKPTGMALEMIATVGMKNRMRFPPDALTLRVALKRNFAWGPDAIVCSIMRPASVAPAQPAPVSSTPAVPPAGLPPVPAPTTR